MGAKIIEELNKKAGECFNRVPFAVRTPIKEKILEPFVNMIRRTAESCDSSAVTLGGISRSVQLDSYSCGAQSCYMILEYFGKPRSIENVQKAIGTDEDGTYEEDVLEYFRRLGLGVRVIPHGTIKDIRHAIDSSAPMLAINKKNDHLFVIYGYSDSCIWVLDPSLKDHLLCGIQKADFSRYWSGWCAAIYKKQRTYDNITLSQSGVAIAGLIISVKSQRWNII